MLLWLKAFHVIFLVTWFAGLFYLPRLFVYHAMATDAISIDRFKIMERKLYYGITTPGAVLTLLTGIGMISLAPQYYLLASWLQLKLILVFILIAYHVYLGKLVTIFKQDRNKRSHVFYRWVNEAPTLLLIGIVILAFVKPTIFE